MAELTPEPQSNGAIIHELTGCIANMLSSRNAYAKQIYRPRKAA